MYNYRAFNLYIQSEILCSELRPTSFERADISIKLGAIPKKYFNNRKKSSYFTCSQDHFFLRVKNVASFLISGTSQIIIEPVAGQDVNTLRQYLLGTCLGVLLHKRQFLALHGSANFIKHGAIIFVGPAGVGKSTIATALAQKGYKILADDISAIANISENTYEVMPGYPQTKLCHDSAKLLVENHNSLQQVTQSIEKVRYSVLKNFQIEPAPLKAICILIASEQSTVTIKRISGIEKFNQLVKNTYRCRFLGPLGLEKDHFTLCSQVSSHTDVFAIYRPRKNFYIDLLTDAIIRHFS